LKKLKPGSSLTLTDLAKIAGVSTSTASRALHNSELISAKTRDKIQKLALEHNFTLNVAASQLRKGRTNVVAVVINFSKKTEQTSSDPFLLKIVGELSEYLNSNGYELLLSNTRINGLEPVINLFNGKRVDGIIIVGQAKQEIKLEELSRFKVPFVVWGDPATDAEYTVVGSNNYDGGRIAAEYLIKAKRKKIIFLGDYEHAEVKQRFSGFKAALKKHQIKLVDDNVIKCDLTTSDAYNSLSEKLQSGSIDFDAIFAASDMVAFGVIKALKENFYKVPEDVAVIGFDDVFLADFTHPSLTTVKQDISGAALLLVSELINKIENKKSSSHTMPVKLVVRSSTPAFHD